MHYERIDALQVVNTKGERSQVSVRKILPREINPLLSALTKEGSGTKVALDRKPARNDADQDTYPTRGKGAPADTLAKDNKATRQNTDQDIHLTMNANDRDVWP